MQLRSMSMLVFVIGVFCSGLYAQAPQRNQSRVNQNQADANHARNGQSQNRNAVEGNAKQKDAVMLEDQEDPTDIYAIPFDDSNVEDEIELDRLEGRPIQPVDPKN